MRKTKTLKHARGTLYANYEIRLYFKKRRKIVHQYGNDTTGDVLMNYKTMFRSSFNDALSKVLYDSGLGTIYYFDKEKVDYDAKLIDYYIIYREETKRGGERYKLEHYENEIPNIENRQQKKDIYNILLEERETKKPIKNISRRPYKARQVKRRNKQNLTSKKSIIKYQENKQKHKKGRRKKKFK